MVTVVCNNGRTYYLIKSSEYNVGDALKYYDELFEDIEIKNTVKEFLSAGKAVPEEIKKHLPRKVMA